MITRHYLFLLLFCLSLLTATPVSAATLDHRSQADVLSFLDGWQPVAATDTRQIGFQQMMQQLQNKRVVFVGETHDRYDHHINQLLVLRAMHRQNPRLAIGVEWFQQTFQPVVDAYLAGQISEDELLNGTDYYNRWRYDFRMLRPILDYAKANHLPVIALNAPTEITSKVALSGLDSLTAAERAQIPDPITPPDTSYLNRLKRVFAQHAHAHGDFENFAMAQRVWDETMAANTVKFLQTHPEHRMVVLAGSGHINTQSGIPVDVKRRMPTSTQATLHSVDLRERQGGIVDYQIITQFLSLPPTGKLGIWLESAKQGVRIGKLMANSPAEKVGLHEGDKIVSLNGLPIGNMAELFIHLARYKPGEQVRLGVKQPNLKGQPPQEVFFNVPLQ